MFQEKKVLFWVDTELKQLTDKLNFLVSKSDVFCELNSAVSSNSTEVWNCYLVQFMFLFSIFHLIMSKCI